MEKISMNNYIKNVCKGPQRGCTIPMELSAGWPSIAIKQKQLCVTVPFFKVQPHDGKVLLYPISHVMTLTWPNAVLIEYKNLKFNKEYKELDFNKPVGVFKHDAVKELSREEYTAEKQKLFALYDELIDCITDKKDFTQREQMCGIFKRLMEPSLYPMYKNLSKNFFESYCGL